ncbi:DUF3784 domain-containing protein [Tenacibaculum maritimum]|uniref:DUF3784 domain-containing protein n=1 Tax=Tenacibaculum maritimum TaxID=107401 RepID=UPI0010A58D2B|nr:DUF3784 domain-containing protein [Tenacibaculum maritimum]QCD61626.1 hypothetical protein B9C57_03260 [Tenacibaculum maritimum]CAA0234212.1 conserved membrane hypothetical protein [Tenacibaculum maritimum]
MIGVAILFIIFGILIKYGKIYWLIAGYNTIPKEQKDKYNIGGIANVFRNLMFGMAFIIFSGYLIAKWKDNSNIQNYAFGISILIGIPYLLLESNSKKYKKNQEKTD